MVSLSTSFCLGVLGSVWAVFSILRAHLLRQKMPPGPRGIPFLGNVFQMPTRQPWLHFADCAKQYGPVVSFVAAGQPVVVLNSYRSAYELLEKRSAIYSDRPRFIMAGELLGNNIMIALISYGSLFRRLKRALHGTLSPRGAKQFQPLQEAEAIRLTSELLEDPHSCDPIVKKSTASTILTAIYGWPRITEADRPLVQQIHAHVARVTNACVPGKSMVDIFPSMNRLPLWMSKWKRDALKWHEQETKMFEGFYYEVKDKMQEGKAVDSFMSSLIESRTINKLSVKEASWLSGSLYAAGAETTAATVASFLLAMIHNPHVMRKAQAELDQVVGRDRLPSFTDMPQLSYICAIVKEVLRWRPAGPMGIPRKLAEDDWYDGYFIPKGTTVICNIWAINRDPSIFKDAEEFIPERHLDDAALAVNDTSMLDMRFVGHCSFGFGRRPCVGMTFASQSLFIDFALLLWAFDIKKARDASGAEVTPSLTDVLDAGLSVGPAPFDCDLVPRHPNVAAVLARSLP